ncbi:MAG: four helix bundle protein [Runella sp.]
MKIQRFEDLKIWQKAQDLAFHLYQAFGSCRDFGFKDQICRAAVSISNNIAEGYGRNTDPQFRQFLYIARASCDEVKSMIYLAVRLNYLNENQKNEFIAQIEEISRMSFMLINYLDKPKKNTQ